MAVLLENIQNLFVKISVYNVWSDKPILGDLVTNIDSSV